MKPADASPQREGPTRRGPGRPPVSRVASGLLVDVVRHTFNLLDHHTRPPGRPWRSIGRPTDPTRGGKQR